MRGGGGEGPPPAGYSCGQSNSVGFLAQYSAGVRPAEHARQFAFIAMQQKRVSSSIGVPGSTTGGMMARTRTPSAIVAVDASSRRSTWATLYAACMSAACTIATTRTYGAGRAGQADASVDDDGGDGDGGGGVRRKKSEKLPLDASRSSR